jgi:hypothetical protein
MRAAWQVGIVTLGLLVAVRSTQAQPAQPAQVQPAPSVPPVPSSVCPDGGAYFIIVFGAQRPFLKVARYCHSFATFAHWTPEGRLEAFTISWLPRTGRVHPLRPWSEQGRNFPLVETLQLCYANRMEVACWGPYQVHPDLWHRALAQKARLESGAVLYKAYDAGSLDGRVCNCLHAVEWMTRQPGQTLPQVVVAPANWGESGSYWVALTLRPWMLEPCQTHDWLLPALCMNPAGLIRYGLDRNPASNPVTEVIQAVFHAPLLPNRVRCGR